MADNEEGGEAKNAHRSDWEVVSLSASAYAAAPSQTEVRHDDSVEDGTYKEAETSRALFMSGHFVFPPSQHENLPLEPEEQIHNGTASEEYDGELDREGGGSVRKDEEDRTVKILQDELPGVQFFDEKGNRLSIHDSEFNRGKEPSPYSAANLDSFHDGNAGSDRMHNETGQTEGSIDQAAESLELSKPLREEDNIGSNLPCSAWWKKHAYSVYSHAKDVNTFWSVFVAAAVMGLVVLGQQWQQERWQILQQKWHLSMNDEKIGRMLSPLSRIKDVIVGGHRGGSLIGSRSSSNN